MLSRWPRPTPLTRARQPPQTRFPCRQPTCRSRLKRTANRKLNLIPLRKFHPKKASPRERAESTRRLPRERSIRRSSSSKTLSWTISTAVASSALFPLPTPRVRLTKLLPWKRPSKAIRKEMSKPPETPRTCSGRSSVNNGSVLFSVHLSCLLEV